MSHLRQELDRYLTIRRSLGYDLGTAERMLKRFIAFAETEGTEHVSADLFLRWQMAFGNANRQTWTARFGVVRRFAEWLHGLDPSHEIIPHGLIPSRAGRSRPYIYRDAEIAHIINAAAELPSTYGLRGSTMSTLFGLIAVTGLRINEALALNIDDVDIEQGILTVQRGKLGKARLVPLEASVVERLTMYITERDRVLGKRGKPSSSRKMASGSATAALGITSLPSASILACGPSESSDGMVAVHASTTSATPSPRER